MISIRRRMKRARSARNSHHLEMRAASAFSRRIVVLRECSEKPSMAIVNEQQRRSVLVISGE